MNDPFEQTASAFLNQYKDMPVHTIFADDPYVKFLNSRGSKRSFEETSTDTDEEELSPRKSNDQNSYKRRANADYSENFEDVYDNIQGTLDYFSKESFIDNDDPRAHLKHFAEIMNDHQIH